MPIEITIGLVVVLVVVFVTLSLTEYFKNRKLKKSLLRGKSGVKLFFTH